MVLKKCDKKLALFASGRGSNAEALVTHAKKENISFDVLICDRPEAPVIKKANEWGIKVYVCPVEKRGGENFRQAKERQEKEVLTILDKHQINWVFLAGYMRVLGPLFLSSFWDEKRNHHRVVNIHPSLLPSFPGKDGYGDAFKAGVKVSGITIHFVDDGVDSGPILLQGSFERLKGDSIADFSARGLLLEHKLYSRAFNIIVNDCYRWSENKTYLEVVEDENEN